MPASSSPPSPSEPLTEVLFVRHGRTAQNSAKRFQGHSDTELDDIGHWQASRLARRLASEEIAAIYSSDLVRARQTAQPLAEHLAISVEPRFDLREIDVGEAVGLTKEELRLNHPALFGRGWQRVHFPGGESYAQATARMTAAVIEICTLHPRQRIVAVTHGGAIRAAVAGLTGIPIESLAGLFVANTSITSIAIDQHQRGRLLTLNDGAHLEPWASAALGEPAAIASEER